MGFPQMIMIGIWVAGFLYSVSRDGQQKSDHDIWATLTAMIINYILLSAGGFFEYSRFPQVLVIVIWIADFVFTSAKHGEPNSSKYNPLVSAISIAISYWVYSSGGFFS